MTSRLRALIFACALSLTLAPWPAAAGNLYALVVGASTYDHLKKLDVAQKDSTAMSAALGGLGYVVTYLADPTKGEIQAAWSLLLQQIKSKDDVALFYFAGHGIELNGSNFLIPREVAFDKDPAKVIAGSVGLQELIGTLASDVQATFEDVTGVFIIDACRENPFSGESVTASAGEIGLAPLKNLPKNVFVMYSAGIGQLALDGKKGSDNSVYTSRLLSALKVPKTEQPALADMAQRIRHNVYLDAKGFNVYDPRKRMSAPHYQTPAYYDQLRERKSILGTRVDPVRLERVDGAAIERFDDTVVRGLATRDILRECEQCPELAVAGAGTFFMGTRAWSEASGTPKTAEDAYYVPAESAGGQKLRVNIPQSFAIGRFEVTVGEWNACVDDSERTKAPNGCQGKRSISGEDPEYHAREPVTGVNWDDAQRYVAWLNRATGQAKPVYRLPTEAEWEYAARAGRDGQLFGFGDAVEDLCLHGKGADSNIGSIAWVNLACTNDDDDGGARRARQTGRLKPNDWGLFDMHGNAAEWVEDCWREGYGPDQAGGGAFDGGGDCPRRVVRGGSWRSGPAALRSAARNAAPPSVARATIGFRVVRELH